MNNDINLIKKNENVSGKKIKILHTFAIGFALFIGLLSVILFVLSRFSSLDNIKKEQNVIIQNITFLDEKTAKFDLLSDRIGSIEKIVDARKNYIETVDIILQEVPSGATVIFLSIDEGTILLNVSSPSLLSINEFLEGFVDIAENKHVIKDTTIESLTINSRDQRYLLSLKAKLL